MNQDTNRAARNRWLVMAVAFLCAFIWAGCGFYAFSLFIKPLQEAFGWERGAIMAAFTVTFLLSGMLSPLTGTAIHRWGARRIIIISAIVFSAGLLFMSTINGIMQYYIFSGLMGLGMTGIGPIPASTVITYHFQEKRGLAMGIMSAGVGLGGLAFSPLVSGLLIPEFGWRTTYIIMALFALTALIPLTAFAFKSGKDATSINKENNISQNNLIRHYGVTLKQAVGKRALWLIITVTFLTQIAQVGAIQNQVPYMNDLNFPVTLVSLCLGLIGFASAIGKYLFGWLCDRIKANHASLIGIILQTTGILILLNIKTGTPAYLAIVYSIVLGLGAGAWLPTLSMMVSENLGTFEYAKIFSVTFLSYAAGTALGPLITSIIFEKTGSYYMAFIFMIILYVITVPSVLMIKKAFTYK